MFVNIHSYRRAAKFRLTCSGRDLYRAISAMTRTSVFMVSSEGPPRLVDKPGVLTEVVIVKHVQYSSKTCNTPLERKVLLYKAVLTLLNISSCVLTSLGCFFCIGCLLNTSGSSGSRLNTCTHTCIFNSELVELYEQPCFCKWPYLDGKQVQMSNKYDSVHVKGSEWLNKRPVGHIAHPRNLSYRNKQLI